MTIDLPRTHAELDDERVIPLQFAANVKLEVGVIAVPRVLADVRSVVLLEKV